jgi:hypothetical protein
VTFGGSGLIKVVTFGGGDLIRGVAFGGSGLIRRRLLYNIFFIICCLNCIYVYVLFVSAGKDVVWFDRYGRKNGFIVYILRYFLLQNWGRNLHIVDKEFLALAAMAFGRPKEKQYQQIALRPTPRCASIASWFQVILFLVIKDLMNCFSDLAKLAFAMKDYLLFVVYLFSWILWIKLRIQQICFTIFIYIDYNRGCPNVQIHENIFVPQTKKNGIHEFTVIMGLLLIFPVRQTNSIRF